MSNVLLHVLTSWLPVFIFWQGNAERCDKYAAQHKQSSSRVHCANDEEMG